MKKKILSVGILLLVIAICVCAVLVFNEKDKNTSGDTIQTLNAEKIEIEVEIVVSDNVSTKKITTSRDNLADALLDEEIIKGEMGQYGLFITEVAGITADTSKEEWWCITKGGEKVMEGVSNIKISNGDKYELTLKVGYGEE